MTTNQPGQAPLCTRCGQHRDARIHLGSMYGHPYTDAKVTVSFTRQDSMDDSPDLSHLERDYAEVTDPDEREKYIEQEAKRLAEYNKGQWYMIGIRAKADIQISRPGYTSLYELESPGLWGVESDSSPEYLKQVFADECAILRKDIEAIISGPIEWKTP